MPKMVVHFHRCIQNTQGYSPEDQYMHSRVEFDIECRGKRYRDLYCEIKQTVGGDFHTDPLEVSMPAGYDGPINYNKFRRMVEQYFRSLVGQAGVGINFQGGSLIMENNTFEIPRRAEFEVPDQSR